jgi:hypothetical protein
MSGLVFLFPNPFFGWKGSARTESFERLLPEATDQPTRFDDVDLQPSAICDFSPTKSIGSSSTLSKGGWYDLSRIRFGTVLPPTMSLDGIGLRFPQRLM